MALCVLHMGPGLRIFVSLFFPSVTCHPPLLQRTCVQVQNRKWCSSLRVSTLGKHHLPSCAKVSACTVTVLWQKWKIRSGFLWMPLLDMPNFVGLTEGWVHVTCFVFFFFSPVVKTLEDSHLYPAVCLFEVSGNTLSLRLVNVSKIWSELDSGHWGYSGRLDSLTCTYAMWSHTAPFCRKTSGKALRAVLHYFFLLSTIFNIFFHRKAMALVLRCNSERPLFVWSCCSEERSTQWPTAVLCTKHSC